MTIVWCSALFEVASNPVFSPNTVQIFNTAGHTDAQSDLVVSVYTKIMFVCQCECVPCGGYFVYFQVGCAGMKKTTVYLMKSSQVTFIYIRQPQLK